MIVIFALLLGAGLGWYRASKLGGNRADKVQYAFGFGIAFTLIGLVVTLVLSRYL